MTKQPRPEGHSERLAREVVSRSLGAAVECYDNGCADRMPDGLIRYADGRTAGLEVVGDHDEGYMRQRDALATLEHEMRIDGLRWSWSASVKRGVSIKTLKHKLPAQLRRAEEGATRPEHAGAALRAADVCDALGLFTATASTRGPAGRVMLLSEPFGGFGTGAEALPAWVEKLLHEQPDVGEKLAAARLGDEGHAFIWVSISSDVAIQTVLDGASTDLPTRSPDLPAGVTHVWVMSGFTSTRGLAWFPNTGWHEVPLRWSNEQPLQLTQPS